MASAMLNALSIEHIDVFIAPVADSPIRSFEVLSRLASEQQYLEAMLCSVQGMLSNLFDASCICNEQGEVRCWQSPQKDEAAASLMSSCNLVDLTTGPHDAAQLIGFLQRMNSKAASTTDLMETLNLKQVKTNLEVQLSGIKVPTRRAVDEARMLVGLKLVKSETLGFDRKAAVAETPTTWTHPKAAS
ncbi:unnamed protein product [Effrenium voratum]|nr:unnamed protein product [Effrenium voratum]